MFYRPYQLEAIDSIWDGLIRNIGDYHPLVAMPTGSGKSVVQAGFIHRLMSQFPGARALCLTHVKELVEQNAKKIQSFWPTAPIGVYSAGLGRKEFQHPIISGGIQSVNANPQLFGHRDVVFVDEAQLVSPNSATMYQKVFNMLRMMNPNIKLIGMSATPYRMGQGLLTDTPTNGGQRLFTNICYDITGVAGFNMLLDDYYLSPLIPKKTDNHLELSELEILGGDFIQGQCAEQLKKQALIDRAITETMDLARGRYCLLTFASGVENTEEIAEKFNRYIRTTCVHSKMSDEQRDNRIAAYKAGHYQNLVVNNIGTVGFDHPPVDCIVDLRATTSVVFHIQKYGRGTRPLFHPSYSWEQLRHKEHRQAAMGLSQKQNCLILDFCTNTRRLGPINDPAIPRPPKEKLCRKCREKLMRKKICPHCGEDNSRDVPLKICPKCDTYNHTPARECCNPECDHKFPLTCKIEANAGTDEIIRRESMELNEYEVSRCHAAIHKKAGRPDFMVVNYFCGMKHFRAYLNFGGTGIPRMKAVRWWRQHHASDTPNDSHDALALFNECRTATRIRVREDQQYPDIMEYLF